MSLRVTNKSLSSSYMNNMQVNLRNLYKQQNQLGTGKEISKPSDDPYRVVKSIGLRHVLAQNEQYKKSIQDAQGWTEMTDTSVQEMLEVLNRFKGQITQAGSTLSSSESLNSISEEMAQGIERMTQIGNTQFDGRYIFGGFATNEPPFVIDKDTKLMGPNTAVADSDAAGTLTKEIAAAVDLPFNVTSVRIQNGSGTQDSLGETLQKVYNTVSPAEPRKTPNYSTEAGAEFKDQLDYAVKEVERHFTNLTAVVAEVGAKQNRLESALNRNMAQNLSTTDLLSKTEDIDYVDKIVQYNSMSNVYDAALASGAKLLQLSLVNYLR